MGSVYEVFINIKGQFSLSLAFAGAGISLKIKC
jgi:hypothetical protein